ncbi:DNA repair protein RecN [Methyloterricola oryzae]|uniref:DNA repair protein RecN n=1 Tax=Methyloterricola oryzae TaxID=1495050 RepID=UPI0005EB6C87|nr:DNA repair protein RecN [Methyloterricola oryzae]
MLENLSIKELAVVEALDLDLKEGLTVLTGETGAGKSILLTALALALGERADSGFVRPGAARAEINLSFSLTDAPEAQAWLAENAMLDEDGNCLIRRVVNADGRSKAFINGRPTTLQALQELASGLVEIHGQHAHLRLLQADEQRRLLDGYAGNRDLLSEVAEHARRWRALRQQLEQAREAASTGAAKEELLRYQIAEMEQMEVDSLDYEALSEEQVRQANVGKILGTGQGQLDRVYEDEQHSANALLTQACHELEDVARLAPEFEEPLQLLREAQIQVKEASQLLRRGLERLEADPARLVWLDEKLGVLHRLARKHQVGPRELAAHLESLRVELNAIELGSGRAEALETELAGAKASFDQAAARLTQSRQAAAARLQAQITGMIRELGMPQGDFLVQTSVEEDAAPAPQGNDRIEFLVSANPGLPPRPLGKVASGGELSRISLAIQVAATDAKTTPTLVFDEVDSGIGGGVAEIVGQKLQALGVGRQVFCVTHLHQVAAQGHQHLLVEKTSQSGRTQTGVRELDREQRKHEIARMLGGVRITEQTLAHAEEMLNSATNR